MEAWQRFDLDDDTIESAQKALNDMISRKIAIEIAEADTEYLQHLIDLFQLSKQSKFHQREKQILNQVKTPNQ